MFDNVKLYCISLKRNSPAWGYYPNTTKIILIVHPYNIEAGKLFVARHVFKFFTGALYLGGYIGDDKSKREWLKNWKEKRERNIHVITKIEGKYP